ncbi:MAG TPA: cytochrome c family protein [Azospirillum sp.]|nr:cytochrome c family protein [Azospirillum sp.]
MVRFYAATLAGAMLLSMGIAGAAQADEGDAAAGQKVFNACKACHTIEAGGPNRVGPNLHGVFGRKAGAVESFKYSDAIKNSGLTWDEATLNEYLKDPKGKIPGNRMAFSGVKDDKQRADLTAYLKKQL